ncbi:alkaline phosphatase family protein [Shewanella sp. 202IG2-18]|uniref:alkaline phosphatase D family protein n=1 Tax=Parashewanella hymeniacidonis TaxID=2807618 RepID=UPI0019620DE7|nr:alkaline phosphatase D family protein [Parashewanella hymeniacidonis]MBM7070526.1 alkaline phosphatase family protein [Parashewanella hymeniacidonis]
MKLTINIIFFFFLFLSTLSSANTIKLQKIYFGSCAKQYKPMPIFDAINRDKPDVFIMLGDNVYGDTEDMKALEAKYQRLGQNQGFKTLKQQSEIIAIWDDHDFGENDAGKEYPQKESSRKIMLDFFEEPKDSARYTQKDGIYTSYFYGDEAQKVHVILPDLRWNRDKLHSVSKLEYATKRIPNNMGPYTVSPDKSASMLGDTQWQWLEKELLKPSKIKIIGSSLQLLPEFTGWESWANFPNDRNRLISFIKQHKINGVLLISGDTHWGEISKLEKVDAYPLWEVTSSGLSEKWKDVSPNKHRMGDFTNNVNYGFIEIDWNKPDPIIEFGLKNKLGNLVTKHQLSLSELSFN